ncbi:MAG: hypothetical protein UZ14_CFX002001920, partial [Chloroflexi bacterium OLB14]
DADIGVLKRLVNFIGELNILTSNIETVLHECSNLTRLLPEAKKSIV